MSEGEVWRDVEGFEGFYKVSNKGNVYRVERIGARGRECGGRTLKPAYDKDGYLKVSLCKNGMRKNKYIHRLVAEAFILNPESLPEINHIDEVKDNNNVENLEWCTREHNLNHGTRTGRATKKTSKKVRAVNVENGEIIRFKSTMEAERKGYHSGSVSAACRGVYNTGGGNLYRGHRWYYIQQEENK